MEELGVIMSKIYNINWLSAVMKVLQLHHFLLCMSTTLKDLKKDIVTKIELYQWERSDPKPKETNTRQTESSKWGPKVDNERMWNFHYDTQNPVGAGRGTGDGATPLTEGQHQDRGTSGDETHRGHSHVKYIG